MRHFEVILIIVILVFALMGNIEITFLALGLLIGYKWKCEPIIKPDTEESFEINPAPLTSSALITPEEYESYKEEPIAPAIPTYAEISKDADDRLNIITQQRTRDKHSMTANALKDSNFYKHHFASELDDAEKKIWWEEHVEM